MVDDRAITYRIGTETNPTSMLLALARIHGVHDEVEKLLEMKNATPRGAKDELGPLLRRQRNTLDWRIRDVHERSNISCSQLSFYESGDTKNPGLRTIQALSYGYRLPFIVTLMAALREINPRMSVRKRG